MASRRKSARPTNKVHQLIEEDDEEDVNSEEPIHAISSKRSDSATVSIALNGPTLQKYSAGSTVQSPSFSDSGHTESASRPFIAIPSDLYEDFEAIKSATKLDTTDLMRKLLKDYHRLAASPTQLLRERRLDGVIGDIMAKTSFALDLSSHGRKNSSVRPASKDTDKNLFSQSSRAPIEEEEVLENEDDEVDNVKPLDLTLHRQEQAISPDSAIVEDINIKHTKSSMSPFKQESQVMETFESLPHPKHTGSYVINLEGGLETTSPSNSVLAHVLTLDIPSRNVHKIQNYSIGSPKIVRAHEYNVQEPNQTSLPFFAHKMMPSPEMKEDLERTKVYQNSCAHISKLSEPPTYSEALSSVIHSHTMSTRTFETTGIVKELPSNSILDVDSFQGALKNDVASSFQKALKDFHVTNISSCLQLNDQPGSLLKQCVAHLGQTEIPTLRLLPSNEPGQNKFNENPILSSKLFSIPAAKMDSSHGTGTIQSLRGNDVNCPNFLLDSQSLGLSPNSATLGSGAVSSTTSIPVPAFFMTAPSNCVSNVVAVLHSLPEGITGLQPFAFAPHPVPQPSMSSSQISADMIFTTAGGVSSTTSTSTSSITTSSDQALAHANDMSTTSHSLETNKPKPGRPRGKHGRGQVPRIQNKDMKLLTENTLFPGVYTSILKLPWSRRSRNKTKVKTITELKKDAQIVVNERVTEDSSLFHANDTALNDQDIISQDSPLDDSKYKVSINLERPDNFKHLREHIFGKTTLQQESAAHENDKNFLLQSIQLQKQKDLEQQQRLHAQYHQRLQEEQRKLTKQIEMSYLNIPNNTLQSVFSLSQQSNFPIKQEAMSPDGVSVALHTKQTQEEGLAEEKTCYNVNSLVALAREDKKILATKSPRKRGRPPKIPMTEKSWDKAAPDLGAMPTESFLETFKMELEPDNFLNVTTAAPTDNFSILKNALSSINSEAFIHQHLQSQNSMLSTSDQKSVESDIDVEQDIDKKLSFLNTPVGFNNLKEEVFLADDSSVNSNMDCDDEPANYEQETTHNTDTSSEPKPRRKKVSRLLKSNDNFMYATFKIKPKYGDISPRKSRRKRKDVLASTAAAAETIANLRQKKSLIESSKSDIMVAWKFHEHYPHSNETSSVVLASEKTSTCVSCGKLLAQDSENSIQQQCKICISKIIEQVDRVPILSQEMKTVDSELKAECCVTCGQMFQKHYSDTSARCNECIKNTTLAIQSSKLFSFGDSSTSSSVAPTVAALSVPTQSVSTHSVPSPNDMLSNLEKRPNKNVTDVKVSNTPTHIHCSVCHLQFTKICDYLHHAREDHGGLAGNKGYHLSVIGNKGYHLPKSKISKTKKSLSHKTLTCPVEDCPHFFREQKDLDTHFIKNHTNLGTCPHADCNLSFSSREDLENHLRYDHEASCVVPVTPPATAMSEDGPDNISVRSPSQPSTSEKPLQCEYCDYRCRQKNALTWHMRKHPEAASQYKRYNSMNTE